MQHEQKDETTLFPALSAKLPDLSAVAAMSRVHREIQHLATLLVRLAVFLALKRPTTMSFVTPKGLSSPSKRLSGFLVRRKKIYTNTSCPGKLTF